MKTIKNYIIVFLIIFLTHLSSFAQYSGGNASGAATESISITSCGIPAHFNAYFGGDNDGATVDELSNTACGIPPSFFAYIGGENDGATVDELSATVCGIPPSFYAYMGGENDTAATDELMVNICPFPSSFYAYFGGDGSGFVLDKTAPVCPTQPPVASFTASATEICVGQSVTFTDTSTNIPSGWNWTFSGGTPSTSTAQNPVITYNTAGNYAVTLQSANFNGTNSVTQTGYITVYTTPTVTSTAIGSRCDAGSVTLGATTNVGTLSWYADSTGGTAIGTGTSFATPSISATTTFYVESKNGVCPSVRVAVIATVNTTPTVIATTPGSRCGTGSVSLIATSSAGSTAWYATATGGTALATTNSFSTPSISTTTTYYVAAVNGNCISPRTAVIATINPDAIVTATTPGFACDSGTVTLGATTNAGILNWYNVPTGGAILSSGTSFTTPNLTVSTTYYVEVVNGTCISARTAVVASVNPTPLVTSTTQVTPICVSGSTTLTATSNYNGTNTWAWYDAPTGGTLLSTSISFITPVISSNTIYYVATDRFGCTSPRTAITAVVTATPTITSSTPASRCGTGSVALTATASAGNITWWTAATGGTNIGSGSTLNTPSIATNTTYYVQTTNNTCVSARTAVVATIDTLPTITAINPASQCGSGSFVLNATSSGTMSWFANSTGGLALTTGSSYATPTINATTIYYVESTNGTCITNRTAVTATITNQSAPTGTANQSFCTNETVGQLVTNGANVNWYATANSITVLPNTTLLVSGSTYYATQTISGCESNTRLAVTVTTGNCLANESFSKIEGFKLYPNPVIEVLNVTCAQEISKIEISNILGQTIDRLSINANDSQIDMSRLSSGTYLIKVTVNEKSEIYKVIKK
jgi:PKD repeat protein